MRGFHGKNSEKSCSPFHDMQERMDACACKIDGPKPLALSYDSASFRLVMLLDEVQKYIDIIDDVRVDDNSPSFHINKLLLFEGTLLGTVDAPVAI